MDAQQIIQLYLALWLGVLGAVLGSFLDCAAGRYAAGAGWIPAGRSRCGSCGHVLGPADLVPVFSFLLRRGKCRHCGGPIPRECLAAELAGAALFAALALKFGPCPELVMWLLLGGILLLLTLVDWHTHSLPDPLLLAAAAVRVVFLFLMGEPLLETLGRMALGAFGVSVPLLLLSLAMDRLLGRESLGGGDIKLMFVLGLYMGLLETVLLLFAGCVLALAWALGPGKKRAGAEIPFGPFLAAGWALTVLFGDGLIAWYQGLLT